MQQNFVTALVCETKRMSHQLVIVIKSVFKMIFMFHLLEVRIVTLKWRCSD